MKRLILMLFVLFVSIALLHASFDSVQVVAETSVSEQALLNGRIYNAKTGRFLSADPSVPDPYDLQSYNRYSYCRNNPLSRIDPTGYSDCNLVPAWDTQSHNDGNTVPSGGTTGSYYTMTFHGGSGGDGFYADSTGQNPISQSDIVNALNTNGHSQGQPVEMVVCNSGIGNNLTVLQAVAAQTGAPIIATLGTTTPRMTKSGRMVQPKVTDANGNIIKNATGDCAGRVVIHPDGTVTPYDPSQPVQSTAASTAVVSASPAQTPAVSNVNAAAPSANPNSTSVPPNNSATASQANNPPPPQPPPPPPPQTPSSSPTTDATQKDPPPLPPPPPPPNKIDPKTGLPIP